VERDLLRANDDGGGGDDDGDGDEESSFEEMESRVPSFNAAREAVQVWVASCFDEHTDSWWRQEFISAQVKPAAVTLALAFEFDKDRSKSVRRGLKRKEQAAKRGRDDDDGEGEEGPPPVPLRPVPVREKKRTKTMDNALHRIPWTAEETQALCQGVLDHGGAKWAVICKANALSRRSNVHCKDRMRTLMRQYDAKTLAEQYLMTTNGYSYERLCQIDSEQRIPPLKCDRFVGKKKKSETTVF
jgi:Myb-like DNA-binding domain